MRTRNKKNTRKRTTSMVTVVASATIDIAFHQGPTST